MRQPKPTFAHEVDSRHVLFRFAFRLIVLTVFASLGTRGFGPAFAYLRWRRFSVRSRGQCAGKRCLVTY